MKQYSFHLFEAGRPEQCFFSPFFASSVHRYLSAIHEIRLRRDAAAKARESGAGETARLDPSLSNSSHSAIKGEGAENNEGNPLTTVNLLLTFEDL